MRELLLTNDAVLLSFAQSLLSDAGIETFVFDQHISGIEGSIGVFPRRLAVTDEDWPGAVQVLKDADLGSALVPPRGGDVT